MPTPHVAGPRRRLRGRLALAVVTVLVLSLRNGPRTPPRTDPGGGSGPGRSVFLEHYEGTKLRLVRYDPVDRMFRCQSCSFQRRAAAVVVACRQCGKPMTFTDPENYGCADPDHLVGFEAAR